MTTVASVTGEISSKILFCHHGVQCKIITYSQWIREYDVEEKKSKVLLVKRSCNIIEFINDVLLKSISSPNFQFPEHLRKAWTQWDLTKRQFIVTVLMKNINYIYLYIFAWN